MSHIHKKIDFCSETFIVYRDTVLLRKHDKLKKWLSVGGHIELDEDPNEAALREVKEEVGLDVVLHRNIEATPEFCEQSKSLIPPQFLNRHPISDEHEHIAFIFFARAETNELKLSDTEISDECRWFSRNELLENKDNIPEDVYFYAMKALEVLLK